MNKTISHEGIVESIGPMSVQVRILQTAACAGCKVASRCSTAEAREKLINVAVEKDKGKQWAIGQQVVVTTDSSMAGKALTLGFGYPLAIMLLMLAVSLMAGLDEGVSALLMLGSLVPYYIIIWLCRDRLAQKISFKIETQTN